MAGCLPELQLPKRACQLEAPSFLFFCLFSLGVFPALFLVAPHRVILRYYRRDTPYRAILNKFQGVDPHPNKNGSYGIKGGVCVP